MKDELQTLAQHTTATWPRTSGTHIFGTRASVCKLLFLVVRLCGEGHPWPLTRVAGTRASVWKLLFLVVRLCVGGGPWLPTRVAGTRASVWKLLLLVFCLWW